MRTLLGWRAGDIALLHGAGRYSARGSWVRTAAALPLILAELESGGLKTAALRRWDGGARVHWSQPANASSRRRAIALLGRSWSKISLGMALRPVGGVMELSPLRRTKNMHLAKKNAQLARSAQPWATKAAISSAIRWG